MYATRSPVREDQTNRCMAVARVLNSQNLRYSSYTDVSHRLGVMTWPQKLTNQYQDDVVHHYEDEREYTPLFLSQRQDIISSFMRSVGANRDELGRTRTIVLMIANEGVMDLLLNLICSARSVPAVDLSNFVVFVGQPEYVGVVQSMGARAFYHAGLGAMPARAADNYADRTFARVMWLKVTAVYTALAAGFHVLFQDVDVVWMRDPVHYLIELSGAVETVDRTLDKGNDKGYDILFMDDGARTPRFAPYFTNTGFYFVRQSPRSEYLMERLARAVGEISYTASHQATLIRHLAEAIALAGLRVRVLSDRLFPSGRVFHEQKDFVQQTIEHHEHPFVWHMCWTDNRDQKVEYYRHLGLWFVAEGDKLRRTAASVGLTRNLPSDMCIYGDKMLEFVEQNGGVGPVNTSLGEICCSQGVYWSKTY